MRELNAACFQHALRIRAFKNRIERSSIETGGRDGAVRDVARRIARDIQIGAQHAERAAATPGAQVKLGNLGVARPVPVRIQLPRLAHKIGAERRRETDAEWHALKIAVCVQRKNPGRLTGRPQRGARASAHAERIARAKLGLALHLHPLPRERAFEDVNAVPAQISGRVDLRALDAPATREHQTHGVGMQRIRADHQAPGQEVRIAARRLLRMRLDVDIGVVYERLRRVNALPQQCAQLDAYAHIIEEEIYALLVDLDATDAYAVDERDAHVEEPQP